MSSVKPHDWLDVKYSTGGVSQGQLAVYLPLQASKNTVTPNYSKAVNQLY